VGAFGVGSGGGGGGAGYVFIRSLNAPSSGLFSPRPVTD
jgi:hypothetical protein